MIYGDIRSSFSPKGREYVTRWNPQSVPVVSGDSPVSGLGGSDSPLASALMGSPISQTTGGRDDSKDNSGEFSATASDSTKGSTTGAIGSPNAAGFLGGGFPGMGYGKGGAGGMIGTGLGLAAGLPGAGLVGNMVGTAMDVAEANNSLNQLGQEGIGLKGWGSGVLNNMTFGLLGDNIGLQWGNRLNAASPYGMFDPQAGRADPGVDPFADPMSDPYGGFDPNNMGPSADPFAAGDPYGGGDPNSGLSDGGGYGAGMNDGSGSDAPGGFAKGGHVTRDRLHGPNPAGPDDGYAALDAGEFVIKASDVKKLGGPDKTRKRLAELLASK